MPQCPNCARSLMRVHRKPLERLIYSEVFRCAKCGHDLKRTRIRLRVNIEFIFSRHTRCVRCGTIHVHRSAKLDRIDLPSKSIFSRLQHLVGAPLNKCVACRIQYYDWRRPVVRPDTVIESARVP